MDRVAGVAVKRSPQPLGAHYRSTPATHLCRLDAALLVSCEWLSNIPAGYEWESATSKTILLRRYAVVDHSFQFVPRVVARMARPRMHGDDHGKREAFVTMHSVTGPLNASGPQIEVRRCLSRVFPSPRNRAHAATTAAVFIWTT
jgi:hypothetical protein